MSSLAPDPAKLRALLERYPELKDRDDLPALWAAVGLAMREQNLIRGLGSVPGELAETLIAEWYDGELLPQATPDVDVRTPNGRTVQVKALRYTNEYRGSVGAFLRPIAFDELAVVCFELDMTVREVLLIDAPLLRIAEDEHPGILTPGGKRLTLSPRLRERMTSPPLDEFVVVVPGETIRTPSGGARRDEQRAQSGPKGPAAEQIRALLDGRASVEKVEMTAAWHLRLARETFPPYSREKILGNVAALVQQGLMPAAEADLVRDGVDEALAAAWLQMEAEGMPRSELSPEGGNNE